MAKLKNAHASMSPAAARALADLGERLSLARRRRRLSQREWCGSINVALTTGIRIERGSPVVSVGAYLGALRFMSALPALAGVAYQDGVDGPPGPLDSPQGAFAGLADRLAHRRRAAGATVPAWAAQLGVSPATVSRLEAGTLGVSMGVVVCALEACGDLGSLAKLADPAADEEALAIHLDEVRSRASLHAGAVPSRHRYAYGRAVRSVGRL